MRVKKFLIACLSCVFLLCCAACSTDDNKHSVKFVNYNNELLLELALEEGEMPEYSLNDPTREGTAEYSYTFIGWDKVISAATEDIVYKAVYEEALNVYTVTFANDDGTVLETAEMPYGATPVYTKQTPEKAATAAATYTFVGWDKELGAVMSDTTYTATYSETKNSYTVKFVDLNNNVLSEKQYTYGETPSYDGETPTLAGDVQYSYTFDGWDKELAPVTADVIYRPSFKQTVNEYAITFNDENGDLLETKMVPYGTVPECNAELLPSLPANTAQYSYVGSWDKKVVAVTGEATYRYVITQLVNQYTVTFKNADGNVLSEKEYEYGETPVFDLETPAMESTLQYSYAFTGWDKEIATVTEDAVYTAQYQATERVYKITFVDENGYVLQTSELKYNVMPVFEGTLPTVPETDEYNSYSGAWDKEFVPAVADATYTYTVTETALKDYNVEIKHLRLDQATVAPNHYGNYTKEHSAYQANGTYLYTAPTVEGYTPFNQYIYFNTAEELLTVTIYYSEVDVWDGTSVSESLSGTGTEEDPYLIQSGADLAYLQANFETYTGTNIKMTKSIDVSANGNFMLNGNLTGVFDGNNCTILGLNITGKEKRSLFFYVSGTVKNLALYGNVSLTGNKAAAFAEYVKGGKLINCVNYCTVVGGGEKTGGLVGDCVGASSLENCVNYGSVTGNKSTGGIVGYAEGTTAVKNCVNYGVVNGTNGAGGIIGWTAHTVTFEGCVNYGTIVSTSTSPTDRAGGIVGRAACKSIKNCINYGDVTSRGYAAGITAETWCTITNCENYGKITGTVSDFIGAEGYGLSAKNTGSVAFSNCKNEGEIVIATICTIQFVNDNGDVLLEIELLSGETPVYTAADPTKEATAQYSYTFKGWDKEIVAATGDAVYTATFEESVNVYTVTFENYDGSVLETQQVAYGSTPNAYSGETPVKPNTETQTYTFKGWDKELSVVTGDVTYTAQYETNYISYTITFADEEGNVLQTSELKYNETPVFEGTLPTVPEADEYNSYSGAWDKEFVPVTEETTYTYVITKTILKPYNVEINHLKLDNSVIAPKHYGNYTNEHSAYQANGTYLYTAPTVEGYTPFNQYIYFNTAEELLSITIYYSEVDVWDGTSVSESLSGTGTEEDPYLIQSGADLAYLQANWATYCGTNIKMTKSIDISANGNFMLGENSLTGVFDGNNCSILGLNITGTEKRSFFYYVSGTVKNLALYGSVSLTGNKVSALAEYVKNGKLINCVNYCTVEGGGEKIGGLVGDCVGASSIENCVNYGSVIGGNKTGGIAGYAEGTTAVKNCVNYGVVNGKEGAGGVTGWTAHNVTFEGCVNYGTVTATTNYAGGIVGRAGCKSIKNCVNYGDVTSANYAGGITGTTWYYVQYCENYGTITAMQFDYSGVEGYEDYVGLVGQSQSGLDFTGSKDYGETVISGS